MHPAVTYNGVKYRKHPKQPYYYRSKCPPSESRCLHRQKWMDAHGPIPAGMDVHHKDHDASNNDLQNYELIERIAHNRMHGLKRAKENPEYFKRLSSIGIPLAAAWHGSKEGLRWHYAHAKRIAFGHREPQCRKCDHCGVSYEHKSTRPRFCSNACKTKARNASGVDNVTRNCLRCSAPFEINKYRKTTHCSRRCFKLSYWDARRKRDAGGRRAGV